jgi:[FeFe] hydrogenase (group B1/B3)
MSYINYATIIRRDLMSRIARITFENKGWNDLDHIPVEMIPKNSHSGLSGCIYKDRAILRSRIIALLGLDAQQDDEISLLSDYAKLAVKREKITDNIFTLLNHACAGCVTNSYVVTNACQGCIARPCMMNCPKKAIRVINGKAIIDEKLCVNCGICQQSCPYHAITYIPIPCLSVCPVGAVEKDDDHIIRINEDKCIHCGQCIRICPFNAIMDRSQILDVIRLILSEKKSIALIAPAVAGQFSGDYSKLIQAIRQLGFDYVVEVASGADVTTEKESEELFERLSQGHSFMTSSCCPAYVDTVERHLPELNAFVSHTKSPMYYTAIQALNQFPDGACVFIGPCTAKKQEAFKYQEIKYVITFEELGAMLSARNIQLDALEPSQPDISGTTAGRSFAVSGGVSRSILSANQGREIKVVNINGLNKKSIQSLKLYVNGTLKTDFIEVMTCEGGCIAGPNTVSNVKIAEKFLSKLINQS